MGDDSRQTMKEITAQIFTLPAAEYLASDEFSYFCREHDLWDPWREYLRHAQDRADLFGISVYKHAFTDFLYHMYRGRKEVFLSLFTGLMVDFSRGLSCPLPVDDLRRGMLLLGYSENAIDHAFFILRIRQEPSPPPSGDCCTGPRKVIIRR